MTTSDRQAPSRVRRRGSAIEIKKACIRMLTLLLVARCGDGFCQRPSFLPQRYSETSSRCFIYAPPGSGYAGPEDEVSALPDSYEPMMEYPGTMRPGRTPENMPFHDLPIADSDPDPVPWPHFQQIEWHHQWEPPHEHPIPMEEFIEMNSRWATPEMEAAMRAGVRQSVRDRREQAEAERRETIITDDDDDEVDRDEPVELGDGVFGQLGSAVDQAATAAAAAPPKPGAVEEVSDVDRFDDGLDDFLLDLGLDLDLDDDQDTPNGRSLSQPSTLVKEGTSRKVAPPAKVDDFDGDDEYDEVEVPTSINVDDDGDLDFGLDEEDEEFESEVPLEDFGDSDTLDTEDIFDEGGFDFDDGDFDSDGGDVW